MTSDLNDTEKLDLKASKHLKKILKSMIVRRKWLENQSPIGIQSALTPMIEKWTFQSNWLTLPSDDYRHDFDFDLHVTSQAAGFKKMCEELEEDRHFEISRFTPTFKPSPTRNGRGYLQEENDDVNIESHTTKVDGTLATMVENIMPLLSDRSNGVKLLSWELVQLDNGSLAARKDSKAYLNVIYNSEFKTMRRAARDTFNKIVETSSVKRILPVGVAIYNISMQRVAAYVISKKNLNETYISDESKITTFGTKVIRLSPLAAITIIFSN